MAQPSVRRTIIEAIKTTLEGITRSNTYRSTVPKEHVFFSDTIPEEYPALVVSVGAETPEDDTAMEHSTWRLNFGVECWVDKEDDALAISLEDLLADVRTALQNESNAVLWQKIIELEDLGTSEVIVSDASPNVAQVLVRFSCVYRHRRNNPSQP